MTQKVGRQPLVPGPAAGKSKDLKGKFDSNEIANDVFNLADELGWDKFYLIGHSMCGLAAQKAALLDKDSRIIKILLVTPVSSAGFPADEQTKSSFNLSFKMKR